MSPQWTVQCAYLAHYANTVLVEADTFEEALEKAIEAANDDSAGWRSTDHVSDTFVDAVCEGADGDPWDRGSAMPVPDRFTERGEPPLVTLTGPAPPGSVEVSGGKVRLQIENEIGTVVSELCDPPPPGNKPLVTVRRRPDGAPEVEVTGGRARVRILDR